MFEGRIYYCGYAETNAIVALAAVGAAKKRKRCGETAYHRCLCDEVHPDEGRPNPTADHPKYLCPEHEELLDD